jgi:hypothetical protein
VNAPAGPFRRDAIADRTLVADIVPPPVARPWWDHPAVMLLAMLLATMPMWFTPVPPLTDLLGHLGRYRIELDIGQSPLLARNWDYHWGLIGNLGVDLLMIPLTRLVSLETAAWLVAAALPAVMIAGLFRVARALHGRATAGVFVALPFALAFPYQYGFVNFWLSAGLALHGFAWWVRLADQPRLRAGLFVPGALLVWLTHAYGWGLLGILIGAYQLSTVRWRPSRAVTGELWRAGLAAWPLLGVIPVVLVWRGQGGGAGAETTGWLLLGVKLELAWATLRDQNRVLDIACLGAATLFLYMGLRGARWQRHSALVFAMLGCFAALLLLPAQLFGSFFADVRVIPFIFMFGLLAAVPRAGTSTARLEGRIVAVALALFAVRIAVSASGYHRYGEDFTRHLRALDHVERGAAVAVLVQSLCGQSWRLERTDHLSSMAIVRREAFTNGQWDVPGAELLHARRARGTGWSADPSQFVWAAECDEAGMAHALAAKVAALPRREFDYLWVFGFKPAGLPAWPGLTRLYADNTTVLYRVRR